MCIDAGPARIVDWNPFCVAPRMRSVLFSIKIWLQAAHGVFIWQRSVHALAVNTQQQQVTAGDGLKTLEDYNWDLCDECGRKTVFDQPECQRIKAFLEFAFSCMDTMKRCHMGHVLENISRTCSCLMCTSRCARTGLAYCLFPHKYEKVVPALEYTHVQPSTFEMYCTFQVLEVLESILASACPTVVKIKDYFCLSAACQGNILKTTVRCWHLKYPLFLSGLLHFLLWLMFFF